MNVRKDEKVCLQTSSQMPMKNLLKMKGWQMSAPMATTCQKMGCGMVLSDCVVESWKARLCRREGSERAVPRVSRGFDFTTSYNITILQARHFVS